MPRRSSRPAPPPLERYLPLGEVAAALSTHPRTVSRLVALGRFPAPVKIGSLLRWRERDVTAFLESLVQKR